MKSPSLALLLLSWLSTTLSAQPLRPLTAPVAESAWSRAVTARDFAQPEPQSVNPTTEPADLRTLFAGGARVRASGGRTAAILLDGLSRSATLRQLVDELEQSDVIVYLEIKWNMRRGLAGSLTWVAGTTSFRYVRISLSPDLGGDVMVATLGHELQHAVEIARERSIISHATLASYYATHGVSVTAHWNGWDTLAARQTGDEVRRELAGTRTFARHGIDTDFNWETR